MWITALDLSPGLYMCNMADATRKAGSTCSRAQKVVAIFIFGWVRVAQSLVLSNEFCILLFVFLSFFIFCKVIVSILLVYFQPMSLNIPIVYHWPLFFRQDVCGIKKEPQSRRSPNFLHHQSPNFNHCFGGFVLLNMLFVLNKILASSTLYQGRILDFLLKKSFAPMHHVLLKIGYYYIVHVL